MNLFLQTPQIFDIEAMKADTTVVNKFEEKIQSLSSMSLHDMISTILQDSIRTAINVLIALAIYFTGRWIIKRIDRMMGRIFERRNVERSLAGFLRSIIKALLYILLLIMIVGLLGIDTTSLAAILASAMFAVGMALSGTLQNFAGGVMILLLRPFRAGDYIQTQGYEGTVKEVKLFNTIINTIDHKLIIIPNGNITSNIINNYSAETLRRVDWTFSIAYGEDFDKAKTVINGLIKTNSLILTTPEPFIALHSLGDSAVNIVVRVWTQSENYWEVYFDMNEKVYKAITATEGLSFPFPQLDVHLPNNAKQKSDA